jgi:hypothetical protein
MCLVYDFSLLPIYTSGVSTVHKFPFRASTMGDLDTRFSEKKIKKSRKANYASPNLATPSACLVLN